MIKKLTLLFFLSLFLSSAPSHKAFSNSNKFSVRIGEGFYSNTSHAHADLGADHLHTHHHSTGTAFVFGMRAESDYMFDNSSWTVGVSGGIDFNLNQGSSKFQSFSLGEFNQIDRLSLNHRFELSLKWGFLMKDDCHLFLKAGAVLGHWRHHSLYADRESDTKRYALGMTLGGGIDFPISDNLTVGGVIEYENYKTEKGDYGEPFADWTYKAGMLNVNGCIKYRFNNLEIHKYPQSPPPKEVANFAPTQPRSHNLHTTPVLTQHKKSQKHTDLFDSGTLLVF